MKRILILLGFMFGFTVSCVSSGTYNGDDRGSAAFPEKKDVGGKKLFVFSPRAHAWAAYNARGYRVGYGRASGGASFCKDIQKPCRTVTGNFRVYRKQGSECKSSQYPIRDEEDPGGAPMPYCMHFYNGYAIHGSSDVPYANVSHGCIRVTSSAAEWLNKYFMDIGTRVQILSY